MPKTGMFKFARLSDIPESQFRSSLSSLERPDHLIEQEAKSSILSPLSDKQADQAAVPVISATTNRLQPQEATTSKTNLIPQRGRRPSLCSSISMLDLRKVQKNRPHLATELLLVRSPATGPTLCVRLKYILAHFVNVCYVMNFEKHFDRIVWCHRKI